MCKNRIILGFAPKKKKIDKNIVSFTDNKTKNSSIARSIDNDLSKGKRSIKLFK